MDDFKYWLVGMSFFILMGFLLYFITGDPMSGSPGLFEESEDPPYEEMFMEDYRSGDY